PANLRALHSFPTRRSSDLYYTAEEETNDYGHVATDAARVVVLTDALWRRRFHADPRVIGTRVQVDGVPREIVGVLPPGARVGSADRKSTRLNSSHDQISYD